MKLNCWEFRQCGRELSGVNTPEKGLCPTAVERRLDGIHGGKNSGRACWAVAGSCIYLGKIAGTYARQQKNCTRCEFYELVRKEEGENFMNIKDLLFLLLREQ